MDRASASLGREIWVKVEEECGAWGGNKVRKLEFILAAAKRDRVETLVSYGAGTSNWTAALAHHAPAFTIDVVVGLAGPVPPSYRRVYEGTGATVVHSERVEALPLVRTRARLVAGRHARSIPMGGSGYGDIGCVHVGSEIARAIEVGAAPRPDAVFVAVGTAGTAAGTSVGLAIAGHQVPVVGVKVAPWPFGTLGRTRRHAHRLLRRFGRNAPFDIKGDVRFFQPGYARPNPASLEAAEIARLDGIELDGTYAAKAFASLVETARIGRGGPLLFIHTSPGPAPT